MGHKPLPNTHQGLLGAESGASSERDGGDDEGVGRPLRVHVEVVDVLEQARQVARVLDHVADDAHQQARAAGDRDPLLLARVPVPAALVVHVVACHILLGNLFGMEMKMNE